MIYIASFLLCHALDIHGRHSPQLSIVAICTNFRGSKRLLGVSTFKVRTTHASRTLIVMRPADFPDVFQFFFSVSRLICYFYRLGLFTIACLECFGILASFLMRVIGFLNLWEMHKNFPRGCDIHETSSSGTTRLTSSS